MILAFKANAAYLNWTFFSYFSSLGGWRIVMLVHLRAFCLKNLKNVDFCKNTTYINWTFSHILSHFVAEGMKLSKKCLVTWWISSISLLFRFLVIRRLKGFFCCRRHQGQNYLYERLIFRTNFSKNSQNLLTLNIKKVW